MTADSESFMSKVPVWLSCWCNHKGQDHIQENNMLHCKDKKMSALWSEVVIESISQIHNSTVLFLGICNAHCTCGCNLEPLEGVLGLARL